MSEKLKPYKTIWVRFISDSNFLGEKEYPFQVTKVCFEEMAKQTEFANYLCFKIKNGSGYDYHGVEVVWMNSTEPISDSQVSNLTEVIHTGRIESIKQEVDSFGKPRIPTQSIKIIHLESEKLIYRSDMEALYAELNVPDGTTLTVNRDAENVIDRLKCTFSDLGIEAMKASEGISNMAASINDYSNSLIDNEIINEKENNSMFENIFKDSNFGKASSVKTSIYGPAFKCGDSYVSYDKSTENYIDVTNLLLDIENMNYKMPIAASVVSVGDYIAHMHKWVRVLNVLDGGRLEVEDIQEKQVITILPIKNIFGFDFYTKLFCFADNLLSGAASAENPFGNILPLMLMSKDGSKDNLLPLMFMSGGFNSGNAQINPLMMYALMNNKDNDNTLLMLMMMNGSNGFDFPNFRPAAFTQHENKVDDGE